MRSPLSRLSLCLLALCACDDGDPSMAVVDAAVDQAVVDQQVVDQRIMDLGPQDRGPVVDQAVVDMQPADMAPPDAAVDMAAVDMQVGDMEPPVDMQPDGAPADRGVVGDMAPPPDMAPPLDMAPADLGPDAAPLGPHGIDSYDPTCVDPAWVAGECVAGMGERHDSRSQQHIADDTPIEYDLSPPCADAHRGRWANWGEYRSLPPQRWLHNLEHGGIALLYHPCAPAEVVDALRELAQARGEDFRWILAPYPELQSTVALVAWEWRYFANCVRPDEINLFFDQRHAMGPEDVGGNGGYDVEWLGR